MWAGKKCPVCGKTFYPNEEWAYRLYGEPWREPVCSWTCVRKSEQIKKENRKRKRGYEKE